MGDPTTIREEHEMYVELAGLSLAFPVAANWILGHILRIVGQDKKSPASVWVDLEKDMAGYPADLSLLAYVLMTRMAAVQRVATTVLEAVVEMPARTIGPVLPAEQPKPAGAEGRCSTVVEEETLRRHVIHPFSLLG